MEQSNGQNKLNQSLGNPLDKRLVEGFYGNSDHGFLVKKIEKLVAALYLVSNFFPEQEPLKKTFKTRGIDLLQSLTGLGGVMSSVATEVRVVEGKVFELASFLNVAHLSGLVSDMNHEVLQRELATILDILSKEGQSASGPANQTFSEEFFTVPMKNNTGQVSLDKGQNEPMNLAVSAKLKYNQTEFGETVTSKDDALGAGPDSKGQTSLLDLGLKSKNKTKRVSAILNLLKRKNNLGIKDFTSVIQGCSEKTIQRELLFLVERGLIKKVGDRRWSRYSLS